MTERRFTEREVAGILEAATAAQEHAAERDGDGGGRGLQSSPGLTLQQLQEIGQDVGIAPEHMAAAANAMARGTLAPTRQHTFIGLPIGVSRTIDFGRPVDDEEWDRLVVALRETFDARGTLSREGNFRQWTNGNLQALLEPTGSGHRLRLVTRKGSAMGQLAIGALQLVTAGGIFSVMAATNSFDQAGAAVVPTLLALSGVASLVAAGVRLPRWARTRAAQMESIASQAG